MLKKISILFIVIAASIIAILFYRHRSQPEIGRGAFRDFNVVLITIDTLRADHLPVYGYTKVKTPNLDSFAQESLVFEDAIAHAPMTLPSHASILSGLLPTAHEVRDNAGFVLPSGVTTLAETLKEHGYNTAAFVSAFVLDSQFGLDQGFNLYSDSFTLADPRINNTDTQRTAQQTQLEVEPWLEKHHQSKFFLWVHYYDPHDPYTPPEPYRSRYKSSPYDGEIAYTDQTLGLLFAQLRKLRLMEKTIIVLTADHGEGLGDHQEQTHSIFIYNSTQQIPLIMRIPGIAAGRIKPLVRHVDIAPTLLEWLGFNIPSQVQGKSISKLLQQDSTPKRIAYSESLFAELHYGWSPLRSITTEDYKFIDAPNPELYDRRADRAELRNLIHEKPAQANALRKELIDIVNSSSKDRSVTPGKMDPETEEKLRSLGYVGSAVNSSAESRNIDPKQRIETLESLSRARNAIETRDFRSAIHIILPVIAQDPKIVDAHFVASTAYLHLGEKEKALSEMMATIRLKPDHTQTLYNLAFFHQLEGRLQEAEDWYLQLLKCEPQHLAGTLNLIGIYRQTQQIEKANSHISRITESYRSAAESSNSPELRSNLLEKLAEIYYKTGNLNQSEESIKAATQLTPKRSVLYHHLGSIYQKTGRPSEAIEAFATAIRLDPKYYPSYYGLAHAYFEANQNLEEAVRLIDKADGATGTTQGKTLRQAILNKLSQNR